VGQIVFANDVAVDASIIVAIIGILFAIGVGLFSWTLVTVVRLTALVGVLEEKVHALAADIDRITSAGR